jgi:D-serine deaminase-like pyridoxal phosphate-dependent protein
VRSARRRTSTPGGLADTAAVGLVRDGALVVAYHDGVSRAVVRRGAVGGALGAPQALAQVRNRPDFSAAIDDAGTATVAFGRSLGRDGIGVAVARARPGSARPSVCP